jgi:hypothetical protein
LFFLHNGSQDVEKGRKKPVFRDGGPIEKARKRKQEESPEGCGKKNTAEFHNENEAWFARYVI